MAILCIGAQQALLGELGGRDAPHVHLVRLPVYVVDDELVEGIDGLSLGTGVLHRMGGNSHSNHINRAESEEKVVDVPAALVFQERFALVLIRCDFGIFD